MRARKVRINRILKREKKSKLRRTGRELLKEKGANCMNKEDPSTQGLCVQ